MRASDTDLAGWDRQTLACSGAPGTGCAACSSASERPCAQRPAPSAEAAGRPPLLRPPLAAAQQQLAAPAVARPFSTTNAMEDLKAKAAQLQAGMGAAAGGGQGGWAGWDGCDGPRAARGWEALPILSWDKLPPLACASLCRTSCQTCTPTSPSRRASRCARRRARAALGEAATTAHPTGIVRPTHPTRRLTRRLRRSGSSSGRRRRVLRAGPCPALQLDLSSSHCQVLP